MGGVCARLLGNGNVGDTIQIVIKTRCGGAAVIAQHQQVEIGVAVDIAPGGGTIGHTSQTRPNVAETAPGLVIETSRRPTISGATQEEIQHIVIVKITPGECAIRDCR